LVSNSNNPKFNEQFAFNVKQSVAVDGSTFNVSVSSERSFNTYPRSSYIPTLAYTIFISRSLSLFYIFILFLFLILDFLPSQINVMVANGAISTLFGTVVVKVDAHHTQGVLVALPILSKDLKTKGIVRIATSWEVIPPIDIEKASMYPKVISIELLDAHQLPKKSYVDGISCRIKNNFGDTQVRWKSLWRNLCTFFRFTMFLIFSIYNSFMHRLERDIF
jgi:hypothetical protein